MLDLIDLNRIQNHVTELGGFNGKVPNTNTITYLLNALIPYIFGIAGLILLLYLLWGGFGWMLSQGDPKAVESAKAKITGAFTGFIIIFIAYWLVQLLAQIFNISQLKAIF